MALVVNPRYVLAAAPPSLYESYKVRHKERYLESYKAMLEMMTTNMLVKIKEAPPYITREWQGLGVRVTIK